MTPPYIRVGYEGQKYRIYVQEQREDGSLRNRVIMWSNKIPDKNLLASFEKRPGWANARYRLVEDDDPEMIEWRAWQAGETGGNRYLGTSKGSRKPPEPFPVGSRRRG